MSFMPEKVNRKFQLTPEGYLQAKAWLIEIGEWDRVSTTGFSTDGYSITEEANRLWESRQA